MGVRTRFVLVLASGALMSGMGAGPASAQAPADTSGGATDGTDPPGIELRVDRLGRLARRTGIATVRGRVRCPRGFVSTVSGTVTQRRGRRTVSAGTFLNPADVQCGGRPRSWSIAFTPLSGERFRTGRAMVALSATVCLPSVGCIADSVEQRIFLLR